MYIGDELIDQTILSYRAMQDASLREAYIQGAVDDMLEKWDDLIKEKQSEVQFFINSNVKTLNKVS